MTRALFVLVVVFPVVAMGQTGQYFWAVNSAPNGPWGHAAAMCSSKNKTVSSGGVSSTYTYTPSSGTADLPASSSDVGHCDQQYSIVPGSSGTNANYLTLVPLFVPGNDPTHGCASKAGQPAFIGGWSGSGAVCDGSCEVNASQPTLQIRNGDPTHSGSTGLYDSTYTGNSCSTATSGVQVSSGAQCVNVSGGATMCTEAGKNCGTVNGDEVCPSALPPGTCESYASGGVACTMASGANTVPSPPGPNNGTAGQAATGTAYVTVGGGATITNYYNSTTIATSTSGVVTSPGGSNVGNGGTGGSSLGSGSQPNAGNGDCGATGVSCSGDGTTPALPGEPTIAQATQTYTSALGQVPIVAAVSNIAASVPSGQCPTATLAVFGHEFVMDAQCTLWGQLSPLLGVCFLAMWTFIGVRIVMSA